MRWKLQHAAKWASEREKMLPLRKMSRPLKFSFFSFSVWEISSTVSPNPKLLFGLTLHIPGYEVDFREWDQPPPPPRLLGIPAPNEQDWGFSRQTPAADSPCAHTMKASGELKRLSVQLCWGKNRSGAWLLALAGLSGGSWGLAVA